MKKLGIAFLLVFTLILFIRMNKTELNLSSYETSASGHQLTEVDQNTSFSPDQKLDTITIQTKYKKQRITGFGGAFTEASASLLNALSESKKKEVIDAYFSRERANYSLTRTHINSCDFSTHHYDYAPVADDKELKHFTIQEDQAALIPMIKAAQKASEDGFKIFASPWTAPPWMKDNQSYVGGKLLPQYQQTWADFFVKYIDAYKEEGIDIWGITVENEPLGNGNNWESMHFSPKEMTDFVVDYLGPTFEREGKAAVKILGYDQNREHLIEWVDEMYRDEQSRKYFAGTAIHWYASTYEVFPEALAYAHNKAPQKFLIQSEACIDAEVPHWQDDAWYWRQEATDWGWDWAPENEKYRHPKYVPAYRYARDIIGCLNNYVDGWVDWNMVLDRQGGPNWFKNWCVAPIIVDTDQDEIYYTPLYYVMMHFSKFIRPGAYVLQSNTSDDSIMTTAAENPDGSIAVVLFNPTMEEKNLHLYVDGQSKPVHISPQAIQTILISN